MGDQLTNSHLLFADHYGMAFGVEIRAPYLDDCVVDLATTIPSSLKVSHETTKYILKKTAEKILPDRLKEVVTRKKLGAPDSISTMMGRLRKLSSHMVSDEHFERHRYRHIADRKLNILLIDLFEYLFVECNGIVPNNFLISDLY